VPAILDHGGEILKFMGDGLLAIFPIAGGDANAAEACRRALAAARAAQANVEALAEIEHSDRLGFRLALHLGEVLYGNIGSGNRLDFTCIGQAVNLAARMEKLAGRLRRVILASSEFARHCGGEFAALGEFTLAGFSAPQQIFGLLEEGLTRLHRQGRVDRPFADRGVAEPDIRMPEHDQREGVGARR